MRAASLHTLMLSPPRRLVLGNVSWFPVAVYAVLSIGAVVIPSLWSSGEVGFDHRVRRRHAPPPCLGTDVSGISTSGRGRVEDARFASRNTCPRENGCSKCLTTHSSFLAENMLDRQQIAIPWLSLLGNGAQALVDVLGHEHPRVPRCDITQALVDLAALRAVEILLRPPNRAGRPCTNFFGHRFRRL